MDSGRDSADLLGKLLDLGQLLDQFGGKLKIVVVRNELRGGENSAGIFGRRVYVRM
jgi:hypothetical protein